MRRIAYPTIVLAFLLADGAFTQDSKLPTQYIDCEQNSKGESVAGREARTRVFISRTGNRAYGVVTAKLAKNGSGCELQSRVYVSKGKAEYKLLFRQVAEQNLDSTWFEGSGIQDLRWSPGGEMLLVEVFQWTKGSDAPGRTKYMILHAYGALHKKVQPDEAIHSWFKKECSAQIESAGWIDEKHIKMQVKPFVWTDEEGKPDGTPSCVTKNAEFSFEILTGNAVPLDTKQRKAD